MIWEGYECNKHGKKRKGHKKKSEKEPRTSISIDMWNVSWFYDVVSWGEPYDVAGPRTEHRKPPDEAIGFRTPPPKYAYEEFRRCSDRWKNPVLKDTSGCFFCVLASHRGHVTRRGTQSARRGEPPHPRIWMRLRRIINPPRCTGKPRSWGSSGSQRSITRFPFRNKENHHSSFGSFLPDSSSSQATCMHCSSPKMVCETKIVADEHEAIPGSKKDAIIVSSSQMWTSTPSPGTHGSKADNRNRVFIREFEHSDHEEVRRIFNEGIMERIPNSAFRGIKQQTRTLCVYALLTGRCQN